MKVIPFTVKWGKETLEVEYSGDVGVKGLKMHLQELTGVPAERMKLLAKSKGRLVGCFYHVLFK